MATADESLFNHYYLRAQDAAARHAPLVISLFAVAALAALAGLQSLRTDLSFRPLFASSPELSAQTEEFEAAFGQASGAWIAAILVNDSLTATEFIREAARLADLADDLPGTRDLLSLTSASVPEWDNGELSMLAAIPQYLLDPVEDEELGYQFEDLLDGTRWVDWLVSADGRRLVLAVKLSSRLENLEARRNAVREFESLIANNAAPGIDVHFSGVSVVELAYEDQVLRDQVMATSITSLMLLILLYLIFGNIRSVLVCLLPVGVAIGVTLGILGWLGTPVTIINTAIPAIVLIIGVADAVHMLTAWLDARGDGCDPDAATRRMLAQTGKACFFTTITTMGGFFALVSAELVSIGRFGVAVALGIFLAWVSNQVLMPWLLRRVDAGHALPSGRLNSLAEHVLVNSLIHAMQRPRRVMLMSLIFTIGCVVAVPSLRVDQRFNEELPQDHPAAEAQRMFDTHFGGFLGPEISIRRHDGAPLLDTQTMSRLTEFTQAVEALPETRHVWSVADLLAGRRTEQARADMLDALRAEPGMTESVSELVTGENDRFAMIVRIGDIGTLRAREYRDAILESARTIWGDDYDVDIVGQWWLAQYGMGLMLKDMLTSLGTAALIVLPLLWIALRELRLLVAATAANLLPLILPLAFMALTGITLRIGTAVVLAIALGIVVDNTLHIIIRLRSQLAIAGGEPVDLDHAMRGTGRAVVFTTLALVCGFLSMMSNQLLVIRDMGLVAAVTIVGAMIADLWLLPAIYVSLDPTRAAGRGAQA